MTIFDIIRDFRDQLSAEMRNRMLAGVMSRKHCVTGPPKTRRVRITQDFEVCTRTYSMLK